MRRSLAVELREIEKILLGLGRYTKMSTFFWLAFSSKKLLFSDRLFFPIFKNSRIFPRRKIIGAIFLLRKTIVVPLGGREADFVFSTQRKFRSFIEVELQISSIFLTDNLTLKLKLLQ